MSIKYERLQISGSRMIEVLGVVEASRNSRMPNLERYYPAILAKAGSAANVDDKAEVDVSGRQTGIFS